MAEVVYVAIFGVAMAAAAVGLWRVSPWARGPVVALQLILGAVGCYAAFEADRPEFGIPVLAIVAVELYLLATPEARLAYFRASQEELDQVDDVGDRVQDPAGPEREPGDVARPGSSR